MRFFKESMKDRGENIEIFDYPETAGVGNPELY